MAVTPKRGRRLAANVFIDGEWYGPSHPGREHAPADADLPDVAYDVKETWPTPDDAARAGLAYAGAPGRPVEPLGELPAAGGA